MMIWNIETALAIDIVGVTLCLSALLYYGNLRFTHPATFYLFFHLYTVTTRLWGVWNDAPTLFLVWGWLYEPVTKSEIIHAALLFDIALIHMSFTWLLLSHYHKRRDRFKNQQRLSLRHVYTLSSKHILRVVSVTFPIGLLGLYFISNYPGIGNRRDALGDWNSSTWLSMTETWAGLSLVALVYWYGFRSYLTIPLIGYFAIMGVQGTGRFRLVIPIVLLCTIYLERRGLHWPNFRTTIALLVILILFFPLKYIGTSIQKGMPLTEVLTLVESQLDDASQSAHDDQKFLDMTASTLTLVDRSGKYFWGSSYLPLLTIVIPRPIWPAKPRLGEHIHAISTRARPMGETGMITTYLGEAYLNFYYWGIIIVPVLLAIGLGKLYLYCYQYDYYSIPRFVYLLLAANLLQVYRDGLASIIIFTTINMMPLMLIVLLHLLWPIQTKSTIIKSSKYILH
jgi:O-antigen polysaccharide polymerase Wzy